MASLLVALPAFGRRLNDKLENRPYADLRPWHLGFGFGFHVDDIRFTHNGFITDDGYQWRADQANYHPGCPIRTSTDQSLLAAPRGFSQLATSFFASRSPGIPLSSAFSFAPAKSKMYGSFNR